MTDLFTVTQTQYGTEIEPANLKAMTRRDDPVTSKLAAVAAAKHRTDLQNLILATLQGRQLTDAQIVADCAGYPDSSVRGRRNELVDAGRVKQVGVVRNQRKRLVSLWEVVT